jgi:hypothetical protein
VYLWEPALVSIRRAPASIEVTRVFCSNPTSCCCAMVSAGVLINCAGNFPAASALDSIGFE